MTPGNWQKCSGAKSSRIILEDERRIRIRVLPFSLRGAFYMLRQRLILRATHQSIDLKALDYISAVKGCSIVLLNYRKRCVPNVEIKISRGITIEKVNCSMSFITGGGIHWRVRSKRRFKQRGCGAKRRCNH